MPRHLFEAVDCNRLRRDKPDNGGGNTPCAQPVQALNVDHGRKCREVCRPNSIDSHAFAPPGRRLAEHPMHWMSWQKQTRKVARASRGDNQRSFAQDEEFASPLEDDT